MRHGSEGNDVTTREETLKVLEEAAESVSAQTFEDLREQARKVAANVLATYGDKYVLNAQGFILSSEKIHEAALLWLMTEGYVELTEKAKATLDELAKRRDEKLGIAEKEELRSPRAVGDYL